MKPVISFVLYQGYSAYSDKLNPVARNLLDALERVLSSGSLRCSVFFDGPTLEAVNMMAKPLELGRIKKGIREGFLEFLGGGYYDSMLPLFPQDLLNLQLDLHRSILKKLFSVEPVGYFNSSFVWEMEMTDMLEKHRYEYAVVTESSIQEALGRTTPVSGWFTTEDKGALMRVLSSSNTLSRAIMEDDYNWKNLIEPYCREGKAAVVALQLPENPSDIVPFMERLIDFVEANEVQTRLANHCIAHQSSEGRLSSLTSVGSRLGLPSSAKTCREILVRRPEINGLHKAFLALYHRGKSSDLSDRQLNHFYSRLMPVMSPIYFRDMSNDRGMRSPAVRYQGYRFLLNASNYLDDITGFNGLRVDVSDYLLAGRKFIWNENRSLSCLLDYHEGGVLESLNFKSSRLNLLSSWRDDGEPSVAFLDSYIPYSDYTADRLEQIISNREGVLTEPYDYQIKRSTVCDELQLSSEQPFAVGDQKGLFQIEKRYGFYGNTPVFFVNYRVTNAAYNVVKGFFGTLLELGMRAFDISQQSVLVDGKKVRWNMDEPLIYPEAKNLEIQDKVLPCVLRIEFETPASLFLGPVYGASSAAAPEEFQGLRIYPFWKTSLSSLSSALYKMNVRISRRGHFKGVL
ncbi:MAG: DUF1926 domain-containing protein [Fibrobacteraceae bacterium]|nr:DUF1926 domain-containing protein [Fibrobacteraceae bacterium]